MDAVSRRTQADQHAASFASRFGWTPPEPSAAQREYMGRLLADVRRKVFENMYDDTAAARRILAACGAPSRSDLRISERKAARARRPR